MANRFFPNYDTYKITSRYGMRTLKGVTKMHKGIDLVAKTASGKSATDYITAHTGGTVTGVGYDKSAGNYLKIRTAPGTYMVYYHLKEKPDFKQGDTVNTGERIGYMGSTGNVTGAHLHFGILYDGNWVDPEPWLDKDFTPEPEQTPEAEQTPAPVPTPAEPVTLPEPRRGDKSEIVRAMQALLILRGCDCGKHGTDGSFGPDTQKAVTAYRTKLGNPGNTCNAATWSALLGVR